MTHRHTDMPGPSRQIVASSIWSMRSARCGSERPPAVERPVEPAQRGRRSQACWWLLCSVLAMGIVNGKAALAAAVRLVSGGLLGSTPRAGGNATL